MYRVAIRNVRLTSRAVESSRRLRAQKGRPAALSRCSKADTRVTRAIDPNAQIPVIRRRLGERIKSTLSGRRPPPSTSPLLEALDPDNAAAGVFTADIRLKCMLFRVKRPNRRSGTTLDGARAPALDGVRLGRHQLRALCRVADGRSRNFEESLRRHFAADRGASAASCHVNLTRCSV
jgi:hypothetical protein